MFRQYPDHTKVSGDCPICNKYQSKSDINWRGRAFCSMAHLRLYMWDEMWDGGLNAEEYDKAWNTEE